MRPWINEKKGLMAIKFEKEVRDEMLAAKKKAAAEES